MDYFGLDIGSVTSKIVKLRKSSHGMFRIEGASIVQTPVSAMVSDNKENLTQVATMVKKGLTDAGISSKRVAISLPESEVFTRIVRMPKMPKSELQSAINWEAEQNIPLPLDEVNYSYTVVDTEKDGSSSVMIVAAPKRLVERYEVMLDMAGLTPVSMETDLLAATRCLFQDDVINPTLVAVIGAKTCDVGIVKQGHVVFTRSIATAGEALTRSLMTTLQLEPSQAESYKRTYGMNKQHLEGKVASAMKPVLDLLVQEIKRTINFYETKNSVKVKTAILTGGTANLPELVSEVAQGLNVEVQIGNPLLKVEPAVKNELGISPELLSLYAISIGLSMKDL